MKCRDVFQKTLAFTLSGCLLLGLSGCGGQAEAEPNESQTTQEEMIPYHENPVSTSDPDSLKDTATVYSQYSGTWAEEDIGWVNGGAVLDITANGDNMTVEFSVIQSAPGSRVASVFQTISVSEIENAVVEIPFDNDGWGCSGTMILTFTKDAIICEIKDLQLTDLYPEWGFCEWRYLLVRNDSAYEALEYEPSDYERMFPDENMQNEDDGIPYVETIATILGQQYTSWNGENPMLGSDISQQYLNDLDDVTYHCYFNWDTQDSSASYEAYGVRDGLIVAYIVCYDDFSPKVNSRLTSDFDGIVPKTITNGVFNHHIWRIDNGYFVCCAYNSRQGYLNDEVYTCAFYADKDICALLTMN